MDLPQTGPAWAQTRLLKQEAVLRSQAARVPGSWQSVASRIRVVRSESLRVEGILHNISGALINCRLIRVPWQDWHLTTFFHEYASAVQVLSDMGSSISIIEANVLTKFASSTRDVAWLFGKTFRGRPTQ